VQVGVIGTIAGIGVGMMIGSVPHSIVSKDVT
jgi:hypothetical protein